MGTTQSNNLAQTPDNTPIADKNTGRVNFIWNQWFTNVQIKLNTITAAIIALSKNATAGFLASDGAGGIYSRTLVAGTNVTITNPTGAGGNPTISASGGGGSSTLGINLQSVTAYTITLTDPAYFIDFTSTAPTVTVPLYATVAIPIGSVIYLGGRATNINVSGVSGNTIYNATSSPRSSSSSQVGRLINVANDVWYLDGDVTYLSYSPSVAYWRVYVNDTDTTGQTVSIAECQFRAIPGGASLCTGGTASASSIYSSTYAASYAFDNDASTFWASLGIVPQWLEYQLTASSPVREVMIQARPSNTYGQSPANFNIQSSPDGVTWITQWTVTGSTGWAAGEIRIFTKP